MIKLLETSRNTSDKSAYIKDDNHIILIDCAEDIFSEIFTILDKYQIYVTLIITNCNKKNLVTCNSIIEYARIKHKYLFIYAPENFKDILSKNIISHQLIRYKSFDDTISVFFQEYKYNITYIDSLYDDTKVMLCISKYCRVNGSTIKFFYNGMVELLINPDRISKYLG